MSPRLTRSGRALLLGGAATLLVAALAGAPEVLLLTGSALGLLAAAWFDASGLYDAARSLRVALELPDGDGRGRGEPLLVTVRVEHVGRRPLRDVHLHLRVGGEPIGELGGWVDIPPEATGEVPFELRFPSAGHWRFHGVELRLEGLLGLAAAECYAPCEAPVTVRPARVPGAVVEPLLSRRGAWRERAGRHLNRMSGAGLELRELRDYVPGDPLKTVAWKATARRQRPLVRAFEEESVRRVQLLIDIGPTMRAGRSGETPLDHAVDLCAAISERGVQDRIGLTSFDDRVYGHLRPETGRANLQRHLHHLLDLSRVVDEDLTETTEAELLARIGAFLEQQEGLELRRVGEDPWHPAVARTLVDPLGELYDDGVLYAAVTRYLTADRDEGHAALFAKARPAKDTRAARLRLFCALRGLPVPYRLTSDAGGRDRGLREAVSRSLLPGGPERLVVVSDLAGLDPDGDGVSALRLAAARKKHVVVVPLGERPGEPLLRALTASRAQVHALATSVR